MGDPVCSAAFWSVNSTGICEPVMTIARFFLKGPLGEESLETSQVNGWLVTGIKGKLTSHARSPAPPTSPGVSDDPDSSNVPSMPTIRW